MARPLFQALPGTRDLISPDSDRMRALVSVFADEATKAGFGLVIPPMFEDVGVFDRLGAASDVVSKELYDFHDKGGRHIALRPEQTASVCRMYGQLRPTTPWKAWYSGPNFRHDKPQKGRYRQFDQVGAEVLGSQDPEVDVELIVLACRFYDRIGLRRLRLLINTLGDASDRPGYLEALQSYFSQHLSDLSEQSRTTLALNPLRVLDSKRGQDAAIVAEAPVLIDYVSDDARAAFDQVCNGLRTLGVDFELAPRLVRGLDYYTRTTFEFAADGLDAAQNAVGGGGRYDGLVADLGGPEDPGVGFALGVDRTLLACDVDGSFVAPDTQPQVWVVDASGTGAALELCDQLRQAGFRAGRSFDQRSMKAQMKAANRSGAEVALIVGEDELAANEVTVRPLRVAQGQTRIARSVIVSHVNGLLSETEQLGEEES